MNLKKYIAHHIIHTLLKEGVDIDRFDRLNNILYITIPKESYLYSGEKIQTGSDLVKRVKKMCINMGLISKDCTMKFKTKDITWTKKMGEKNIKNSKNKILW